MTSRSLGHRAPLLWLVLPFVAGLVVAKTTLLAAVGWTLGAAIVAAVGAIVASLRAPAWWPFALCASMLCSGMASYALHRVRLPDWDALPAREARMELTIERLFAQADPKRAAGLARIVAADPHLRTLIGQRLYVSLALRRGEPAPIRSAVVIATGVLVALPENPPAETFEGYLAGAGVNFRLTRGRILGERQAAHRYYRFCAEAASRCHAILGRGIETKRPALARLLRAMMLGATNELSEEQHTLFMQSGTMHLFAISGLNIGVIAGALQALLLLLRLPPWARFAAGTTLLWLFVDVTGAAPSAVRAFAMATFVQAAFVLRRPANLLAALMASALVVLLIAPLQVFGASFLMSYAIVTALLVLGVPLGDACLARWTLWRDLPKPVWRWWQRAIEPLWRAAMSALAIGLATTLVSLVTGVQFFQLLTPGSIVTNLVLIPAAMIVTLAGFSALLCGLLGFTFGAVLCNHAAALVLLVIESIVQWSVELPGAFMPAHFAAGWIGPVTLVALLATLLGGYALGWRRAAGGWWPPFAVVALTLCFGVSYD